MITLGVQDLKKSADFYRKLGFKPDEKNDGVVFIKLKNIRLSLFPWKELAKDATVPSKGSGFRGFSLAHNVKSAKEVDAILAHAKKSGAKIIKPGQKVFWGGYSGYFADLDGFLWEVAWNPFMKDLL